MKSFESEYQQLLEGIKQRVKQTNKRSVLFLIQHSKAAETAPHVPCLRESITNVIGFVALGDPQYIEHICQLGAGIIDAIVVDADAKRANSHQIVAESKKQTAKYHIEYATYSDYAAWSSSALAFLAECEMQKYGTDFAENKHLIVGHSVLATRIILEMINRGMDVYLLEEEYGPMILPTLSGTISINSDNVHLVRTDEPQEFTSLLACEIWQNNEHLSQLRDFHFGYIYDLGINNFTADFIEHHRKKGSLALRSDDHAGISSLAINIRETRELVTNYMGETTIGDIRIVSGGIIGENGVVVVDNYRNPQQILGVANGEGVFKTQLDETDQQHINKLQKLL